MIQLPQPIKKLISSLSELPSIGPRQATRLAFYIASLNKQAIKDFAEDLRGVSEIKNCNRCNFIHMNFGDLCDICANPRRSQETVMFIEKETDLISIENTGKYTGTYFITGVIPKTGIFEPVQKQRIDAFKKLLGSRVNKLEEIIIGFNPTSIGDFHASLLSKEFSEYALKISRLGRGLPTGGEIEFADDDTLGSALSGRK